MDYTHARANTHTHAHKTPNFVWAGYHLYLFTRKRIEQPIVLLPDLGLTEYSCDMSYFKDSIWNDVTGISQISIQLFNALLNHVKPQILSKYGVPLLKHFKIDEHVANSST